MSYKVIAARKRPWKVHAIANCINCDWSDDCQYDAVVNARKHVSKTGHTVSYEVAYANQLSTIKELSNE